MKTEEQEVYECMSHSDLTPELTRCHSITALSAELHRKTNSLLCTHSKLLHRKLKMLVVTRMNDTG